MDFGVELMSVEVFETLSQLTPFDIDKAKVRVGPSRDGGYVMADVPSGADLISFGIANDVRFEKSMAEKGHRCFMFDHTIGDLPDQHPNFNFFRKGICGANTGSSDLLTLEAHLGELDVSKSLILKIDVEGAEWDAFATMEDNVLMRFEHIVGEFHWFLELNSPDFRSAVFKALSRINKYFYLFHVHANNCRKLGVVGGFMAADVLELSFVRKTKVDARPSTTLYPAASDSGNNTCVHDHPLLFYPFLPTAAAPRQIEEMIGKIERDRIPAD